MAAVFWMQLDWSHSLSHCKIGRLVHKDKTHWGVLVRYRHDLLTSFSTAFIILSLGLGFSLH